jgi:hypothetical protein
MMDVLRAHGIGKGLNAADKQALIDIVNRADSNESVVRTSIINALNAVSTDKALGLSAASTWAEILAKIPQIKTGKKWASGVAPSISEGSYSYVTVTGLGFRPNIIVLIRKADTDGTVYVKPFDAANYHFFGPTNYKFAVGQYGEYIQDNAFKLRSLGTSNYDWIAFE